MRVCRWLCTFSFFLFFLVCTHTVACAAVPLPPEAVDEVEEDGRRQRPHHQEPDRSVSRHTHLHHHHRGFFFSHHRTQQHSTSTSSSAALSPRAHQLRIHDVKIHAMAMPIVQAAACLSAFYSAIVRECASNWVDIPPLYSLRIQNGYFALSMQGIGQPIPWALVAEIAGNMLLVTAIGFTGTYDIRYVNTAFLNGQGVGNIIREGVAVQFRMMALLGQMGSVTIDSPLRM